MTIIDANEALERLRTGNARFVKERTEPLQRLADHRERLADGQDPWATVLTCSDSRVPPELIFDQGLGDLFVVRVAGNIATTEVLGSIEFASTQLGVRLIVVMGHSGCGAVAANR